jgi:subtilase family serine protease
MNSIYSYGAAVEGFHADDRAGVRFLYPGSGSERDLYVSNWVKRTDSSSSAAGRVNSLPTRIRRGQSVTLEYSFGNKGNLNSGSIEIGFYLSSNNIISTGDRLLGFNTGAFANAGGFGSYTRTLTIPGDTTPGTYFIGALMDRTSIVVESSEGNNGLAHYQSIIVDP